MTDHPNISVSPWYAKLLRLAPTERSRHAPAPIWLLWAALEIAAYRPSKPHWLYVGTWVVVVLWAPVWAQLTMGRLIDLRLSRYWVVLPAAAWCVVIFASWWFIFWLIWPSLGLVVLLELPLCLMPSRLGDEEGERTEPA